MKKVLGLLLFVSCGSIWAQSDTLYTKTRQKIVCKIIEVNDLEIKYRLAAAQDGPIFVMGRDRLLRYTLAGGFSEVVLPDELALDNLHADIMNRRAAVKFHPFSFVNSQLSFAYEKVLKVGTALDIEMGYHNSNINYNYPLTSGVYNPTGRTFSSGAYIKPGIKFFLGQDFTLKGMRYAHPLKGRYIRLDAAFALVQHHDVTRTFVSRQLSTTTNTVLTSNITNIAYGGFVNYGRQFILGNLLTLEYYFGVGFTAVSVAYSNSEFKALQNFSSGSFNEFIGVGNYHGFLRARGIGLSGSFGFRIGYILPEPAKNQKKP